MRWNQLREHGGGESEAASSTDPLESSKNNSVYISRYSRVISRDVGMPHNWFKDCAAPHPAEKQMKTEIDVMNISFRPKMSLSFAKITSTPRKSVMLVLALEVPYRHILEDSSR